MLVLRQMTWMINEQKSDPMCIYNLEKCHNLGNSKLEGLNRLKNLAVSIDYYYITKQIHGYTDDALLQKVNTIRYSYIIP